MENLDKLTATGLPVFDLNTENLDRKDWSQTTLGPRDSWPVSLRCLVSTCLLPVPHAAAIFWGDRLAIIHNLAWGKASGNLDGQGRNASEGYSGEALSSLKAAVRGRTVKVDCRFFLEEIPEASRDAKILLSTILDEEGSRQGVLAQLLYESTIEHYMPVTGIDKVVSQPATQTKSEGSQQPVEKGKKDKDHKAQADSMQTQLFQRFAELLPNGLAILDSNAEAVFVNDGFFKLTTNRSAKEFRAWPESIHPSDYERVMSEYRRAFTKREELRVEFRCSSDTGGDEGEWRLFLLRPLSDDSEAGFMCAVVDITEIKQAQLTQEKAATEARERKEQQERFIDMVSHEIRNPLSAVLHLAEEIKEVSRELQKEQADQDQHIADILDAADTILLCVSHQNTLVDDILSFSKLDSMMLSLVPRETRPKWEFSKSLKVFGSEFKAKNIHFHYAMDVSFEDHNIEYVVADLNRMKQVLVNLITNAIKFTAKKQGERNITVAMGASTKRPTSYPPNVVFFSEGEEKFHIDSTMSAEWGSGSTLYLMVAVKDTGIGISEDNQVKLFERFRQATPKTQENYGGSGLGLFISRKLCQLHGGDIGVSSKEGAGSTFGFFFRVRRSDGSSENGRPPFGSRSASESSNIGQSKPLTRPGLGRSISHLRNMQISDDDPNAEQKHGEQKHGEQKHGEQEHGQQKHGEQEHGEQEHGEQEHRDHERPKIQTLTSHTGVDPDAVGDDVGDSDNKSLLEPPIEVHDEAHPSPVRDERFFTTNKVADKVQGHQAPDVVADTDLHRGETKRQAEAAENLSKSHNNEPSKDRPTILLVEDNLINQKVLRRQLQSRGFEVSVANNGQEAIDAVEERGRQAKEKGGRNYFDCILMDQEMPIKDGNAATGEIRELQEKGKAGRSPILGVSANVREAQTKSMLTAGMDAIISKPFKVDDLTEKIKSLLPNG